MNSAVPPQAKMPQRSLAPWRRHSFKHAANVWVFGVGIILFTAGATVGSQFNPVFLKLAYIGLAIMLAVAVVELLAGHSRIPSELRLFWMFCIWALLSGVVVSSDYSLFLSGAERVVQIAVIAFCATIGGLKLRSPAFGLLAVLTVAVMLGLYGLVSGDYGAVTESLAGNANIITHRARSMVHNANSLGVKSVWGLMAVTYFSAATKKAWLKSVLWCAVPLLLLSMVASGSRKAIILPIIYLAAWAWFCHRPLLRRRPRLLVVIILAGIIGYHGFFWVLNRTFAGQRLQMSVNVDEQRDSSTATRLQMYRDAISVTARHPVAGVGIYQWGLYGTGGYAHNDPGEVASTTGLIGLLLYVLPYLITSRRLRQVRKLCPPYSQEYQRAGLCLALLTTILAAAFGQVLYSSLNYWGLVGSVWGYAYAVNPVIRPQRTARMVR